MPGAPPIGPLSSMPALLAPLGLRAFRRLLLGYGVNVVGTWLGEVALAVLVLRETHSAVAVAAVWIAAQFAPSLLVPGLVARMEGVRPHRAVPALLCAEALLFAFLAVGAQRLSLPFVLVVVALDGAMALTVSSLLKASVVAVTKHRGLHREGNALLTGVFSASMAVGPFAGGTVTGLLSPQLALVGDALSFACAALVLGVAVDLPAAGGDEPSLGKRLRAGLGHVRERLALRRLISGYALVVMFAAATVPVDVMLVTETLGASETAYGVVLACWGLGAVAGSAALRLVRRAPIGPLLAASCSVIALSLLGMGAAQSVAVACVFCLFGGAATGVEVFASMTAIQEQTGEEYQARVSGVVEALTAAATGVGFAFGGLIAGLGSPRIDYVFAGLGVLAVAFTTARATFWRSSSPAPASSTIGQTV
jgi:hypothetical protein